MNIAIGKKEPSVYIAQVLDQCDGGKKRIGNITDLVELRENLPMNCIPDGVEKVGIEELARTSLDERRKLMAQKIKKYFETL